MKQFLRMQRAGHMCGKLTLPSERNARAPVMYFKIPEPTSLELLVCNLYQLTRHIIERGPCASWIMDRSGS